jgi:O-antigen ligase
MGNRRRQKRVEIAPGSRLFFFFFGCLFLVVPVISVGGLIDRSMMPRLMLLNALFLVTAFMLLGNRRLKGVDFSVVRQPIFILLAGFAALTIISTAFAGNIREAFVDISRTLLLVTGVPMAAIILVRTPRWEEKLIGLALLASAVALAFGFIQYFRDVLQSELTILPDGRALEYLVIGRHGHKNVYAAFLALMLPLTAFGIFRMKYLLKVASIMITALLLLMILLVKTRSIWLGLMVAAFLAAVLLVLFAREYGLPGRWRNLIIAAMVAGAAGILALVWVGRTADDFSIPGRVYSMFDSQSSHNIHRINVWKGSMQMIGDRPVVGVGPGNWKVQAPLYFQQKFDRAEALRWSRPHNDYIWVAAEKGILALLVFLGIFALAFRMLYRIIRRKKEDSKPGGRTFAFLLGGGLAIYMTDSFFAFPYERFEIIAALIVLLAACVAMDHQSRPAEANMHRRSLSRRTPWVILSLLVFGFGIIVGYYSARMEKNLLLARRALAMQEWDQVLTHARAAKNPFRSMDSSLYPPEFYEGVALNGAGRNEEALPVLLEAQKASPNNIWVLDRLGIVYHQLGMYDEAIEKAVKVLEIIPGLLSAMNNLAAYWYDKGDYDKARQVLDEMEELDPDPVIRDNILLMRRLMGNRPGTGQGN